MSEAAASMAAAHPAASHDAERTAAISDAVEMADLPPTQTTLTDPTDLAAPERAPLPRTETADVFLGPDGAAPSNAATDSAEPMLRITLMLTTGARHPYTISSRYLASRKVTAVDGEGHFDPREMSAYKLKELIWTDWRQEWEPKPRDPAAIRLIIMGRMLEDKSPLKDLPFSLEQNNVVHMTVKPADLLEDEAEGAGKAGVKSSRRRSVSDGESAGCCRCVLQ